LSKKQSNREIPSKTSKKLKNLKKTETKYDFYDFYDDAYEVVQAPAEGNYLNQTTQEFLKK
jgi:hypothetical protein